MAWIVGGEPVGLMVQCTDRQAIFSPIVGFMVKDRLGQVVYAGNTFIPYAHRPLNISSGACFQACFDFSMPMMPLGDSTISAAVAEASRVEHLQRQRIHEALAFEVHSSSACHGLIGVPMESIELRQL